MPSSVPVLDVPFFSGQGNAAADKSSTRELAVHDAETISGSTLLHSCFNAFHTEISSLAPAIRKGIDVDLDDFQSPLSLLQATTQRYTHNSVLSGSTLFLIQSLRYLAYVDSSDLPRHAEILGFSSGIIPAVVVSTSYTKASFVSRAVEAYRLVLWIGIRAQLYRRSELEPIPFENIGSLPWSFAFIGMNREAAEEAVEKFNSVNPLSPIYVTAIMDESSVTVSGRPDILAQFASRQTDSDVTVHPTKINTLYHSPIHADALRNEILADVQRRSVSFPDFSDMRIPIRSSFTGELLDPSCNNSTSLIESVINMVVVEPVNWDRVISSLVHSTSLSNAAQPITFINFGPGNGIVRSMEKSFPKGHTSIIDISTKSNLVAETTPANAIAIVGMAVNMPGAPNTTKLWEVLENGINTVAEIPEHRFQISDYDPTNPLNPKRTMKAHTGNFIDGVDEFDNQFFKISPREARSMDPQQRILLQTAYEALEDAGYVPDSTLSFRRDTFGCFIGVATHDYIQNLRDDIDVYYSTGTLKAFLSGRISYAMQWSGPSAVVDTACSSSMVAIYQGARALMNHDCNAAIVGGANISSSPDMFLGLDRGHFLSPTGQCKPFDASADGYSRSEGCGLFVLKRLDDAITENDNILGVIRGVEVNQSGTAHSITHPHAATQTALFERLLERTGISAGRIDVVEAHGTGTQAGDPVEMESLRKVLCRQRKAQNPLHIMSIKANIGHLEAASGAAGLAKLLLMFRHKTWITLALLPHRLPGLLATGRAGWLFSTTSALPVLMLQLSSRNSSLFLLSMPTWTWFFGFSAKTENALLDLRTRFIEWLISPESSSLRLADIAYTTTARRQIYSHRLCVTVDSRDDLVRKLRDASIHEIQQKEEPAKVIFVFSGQGSQYLGMGRALYETCTAFKQVIDECHVFLTKKGFPGVLSILTSGGESSGLSAPEEFEAYQAAIFALEYGMAKLWISWGLVPAAVVGHSLGEYAALVIAGVLSVEDALTIVASRVRFMVQKCAIETTSMMAIAMSSSQIQQVMRENGFSDITVSCINSPTDSVVSGPKSLLRKLKEYLDEQKLCKSTILSVPFGYHSTAMNPLLDNLTRVAEQISICPPTIPIVSNVYGQLVQPEDESVFDSSYFARHCAEPVQFESGIRSLLSSPSFAKVDAWLEIGPHASLLPMLKSNPVSASNGVFLTSLRRNQNPWSTLTAALSQLYMCNTNLSWRTVFSHIPRISCVSLPTYPFAKTKFWVAFKEPSQALSKPTETVPPRSVDSPVLESWLQRPSAQNGMIAIFETPISKLSRFITGHTVGNYPLCPASVYIEQVLAGVRAAEQHAQITREDSHVNIRDLRFSKPLVYDAQVARSVITRITLSDDSGSFTVSSRAPSDDEETVHVHGEYRVQSNSVTSKKLAKSLPVITRRAAGVRESRHGEDPEVFSRRTAYEVIFPRVVDYSKEYHTMQSLTVGVDGMEGSASVKLPTDRMGGNFVVHPVFMDTLLHVPGFVSNLQGGINDAFICSEVGSVKVVPNSIANDASYEVYCSIALLEDGSLRLAEAFAVRLGESREVVAHMKDIHFRRVRLNSLTKGLALATGRSAVRKSETHLQAPPAKVCEIQAPLVPVIQAPVDSEVDLRSQILTLLSETCAIDAAGIMDDTDLSSLGVDSMMFIELLEKLNQSFSNVHFDSVAFQSCRTVSDILQVVTLALPGAYISTARSEVSMTRTEEVTRVGDIVSGEDLEVKQIMASVLDMNACEINDDADLETLGLDSLTSIEALQAFKAAWKMDLPNNFFTICPTIRSVQTDLSSRLGKTGKSTPFSLSPLSFLEVPLPDEDEGSGPMLSESLAKTLKLDMIPVPLQKSFTDRPPLFVIHDGSGLVNYYEKLSSLDRDLRGIHNPRFSCAKPWSSIQEMASAYADIIAKSGNKSVLLGGWSFGGIAAYETSLQLQKRGVVVKGIVLIDSPSPINHVPLSDSLIEAVVELDKRKSSDLGQFIKSQFRMNSALLGDYNPFQTNGTCPPLVVLRSSEGFTSERVDPSTVPAWLADRGDSRQAVVGWEKVARLPVKIIDIPGNHFEPFKNQNIGRTERAIADACIYLEKLQ
ncbi:hypothetical protein D9758_012473 [Tetrapyrgos nigripes]|uniref:Polyketide synthase n=1 Tax=Tetrapyrgos nigripes TaxID=182062 RepID=A0A8H5CZR7_9AGAR|nr:hypothetical protein D9758_012473 [Tetrapyrgos nigripes]